MGSARRMIRLARVDLPQPDSPTIPKDSPLARERLMPFKACTVFDFPQKLRV